MGLGNSKAGEVSSDELDLVKTSWKIIMENPEENGVFIFKTFLDKHNYYSIFTKFSNIPVSELPKNKTFRRHAVSIIQALNNITLHIGNDSLLKHDLHALGRMHGMKNVSELQFEELKRVILDILANEFKLPKESLNAWNKILDIAFFYIFEGLKEE